MFYVDEVRHGRAVLAGEAAQHLRKVLRAERGYLYEISDNESLWLAEIEDFHRDEVVFTIKEPLAPPRPPCAAHLFASLVKFDAFEWMLEKATELGAVSITPVNALRSDKGLDQAAGKRKERWRRIILESGQQSRRVPRPELNEVARLKDVLACGAPQRIFCDENPAAQPLLAALREASPVAVLIGPEGGWDERERESALASGWQAVSLGPQILRAETASCAALGIIMAAAHAGRVG